MRTKLAALAAFFGLLLAIAWPAAEANATACTAGCVQYIDNSTFSGTSATASITMGGAGRSIRIWYWLGGPTAVASVTTSNTGTVTTGGTTATGSTYLFGMSVVANAGSGATTITVNTTGTCGACEVVVEEWTGDATSSPLDDQSATYSTTASAAAPCGSISPSSSGDTVEAVMYQPNGIAPTNPSGYSAAFVVPNYIFQTYKTGAASGSQNPTFTAGASTANLATCAAFKHAGSGTSHIRLLMGVGP